MGLSRDEIIELASRYVAAGDIIDFPHESDVFCLLIRTIPTDAVIKDEEGWGFGGYGLCFGYTIDEAAKPAGKWLWMHFASLDRFPPAQQVIKLQPPHVAKGRFQNPERTHEIRIIKISIGNALQISAGTLGSMAKEKTDEPQTGKVMEKEAEKQETFEEKVVPFRRKKSAQH